MELLFSLPAMLLCLSGVYAVFTLMLAAAVVRHPRIVYLRLWFAVFILASAGGGLTSLRRELPDYAADYIGVFLIVASTGFVWLGMRAFFKRHIPYLLIVIVAAGSVPFGHAFTASHEQAALARTVYILAAAALFLMLTAWELRRSVKEEGLPSASATSAVYRSFGIMHLLAIPLPLLFPVDYDALVPASTWLSGFLLLSLLHTIAIFFLGIVLSNERMAKAMRKLADTDELTGLANRRSFLQQVEKFLAAGAGGTLLIADIDHFKQINDRYGHQGGDAVLQRFAELLQQLAGERFVAARIGGEEFGIFLPGLAGPHLDLLAAQICRAAALLQTEHEGKVIPVTISAGLAWRSSSATYQQLFAEADRALYLAKRSGRNCFRRLPDDGVEPGSETENGGSSEVTQALRA